MLTSLLGKASAGQRTRFTDGSIVLKLLPVIGPEPAKSAESPFADVFWGRMAGFMRWMIRNRLATNESYREVYIIYYFLALQSSPEFKAKNSEGVLKQVFVL